jgi:hypothetical protein
MPLCDQWCGTAIHFVDGVPHNDRDNKKHVCHKAQIAREFEGYYNMIQIKDVKQELHIFHTKFAEAKRDILNQLNDLTLSFNRIYALLDWQEEQNKPLATAFVKRKEAGRKRNYQ